MTKLKHILFWRRLRWYVRWPVKSLILSLTVFVVCFPNPAQFVRHVQRWRDPNVLIEPDSPRIEQLCDEFQPRLGGTTQPPVVLKRIEKFVYEHLPYSWDWDTWGSVDYIPTVDEALDLGREDCDGRAVIAASMLKHLGYRAELVTDFTHVWVKTDRGETMGARKRKAIVATPHGPKLQPGAVTQFSKALAFGLSVFPKGRELIVLAVLWLLALQPRAHSLRSASGLLLLFAGLVVFWLTGRSIATAEAFSAWSAVGVSSWILGLFLLCWPAKKDTTFVADQAADEG